jgi:hypothetical protein
MEYTPMSRELAGGHTGQRDEAPWPSLLTIGWMAGRAKTVLCEFTVTIRLSQ